MQEDSIFMESSTLDGCHDYGVLLYLRERGLRLDHERAAVHGVD